MRETIPPPQWESFPHGGECHTHTGSPYPTGETNILPLRGVSPPPPGGDRPTPPGGVVQKHLHIKAASRSENDHTPHGGVLPLRVISSYSAPGETIVLP